MDFPRMRSQSLFTVNLRFTFQTPSLAYAICWKLQALLWTRTARFAARLRYRLGTWILFRNLTLLIIPILQRMAVIQMELIAKLQSRICTYACKYKVFVFPQSFCLFLQTAIAVSRQRSAAFILIMKVVSGFCFTTLVVATSGQQGPWDQCMNALTVLSTN